ncbi:MAG: sigma-70 family RNA polymerase sigma factor [Syntrophomonas sp.]
MADSSKLVSRAQKGDLNAFDSLVAIYQNQIFSHCFNLTGNYDDAQDLAQEVFIRAYKSLNTFRRQADFGTWLYRIGLNLWINQKRQKTVLALSTDKPLHTLEGELAREIAASEENPLEKVERDEYNGLIRKALYKLSREYRSVLVLRDMEGYSYEDIAGLLDCSLGTVKSRLSRARLKMREEMNTITISLED